MSEEVKTKKLPLSEDYREDGLEYELDTVPAEDKPEKEEDKDKHNAKPKKRFR